MKEKINLFVQNLKHNKISVIKILVAICVSLGLAIILEKSFFARMYNFISIDAFTCGEHMNPEVVCKLIANNLGSSNYNIRLMDRGILNE